MNCRGGGDPCGGGRNVGGEEYCVVCGTTRGGFDEGGEEYWPYEGK